MDESTSNLDQDLTSEVIEAIKKYQHSRPILLVAHQVVLGMFDKVIVNDILSDTFDTAESLVTTFIKS